MQPTKTLFALIFASAGLFGLVDARTGDATYYSPGLGACGKTNDGGQLVVALASPVFGNGEHCFKKIGIHYKGNYVKATIVDKCPGCGDDGVDLSPSAFSNLANEVLGRIEVDWDFL